MPIINKLIDIAVVVHKNDNCAVARKLLPKGTRISFGSNATELKHSILEGHRFAITSIQPGTHLRSWDQPFGTANHELKPGDYVINQRMLDQLVTRNLDFRLPNSANFEDYLEPFTKLSKPVQGSQVDTMHYKTFEGFLRPHGSVGTRNYAVVLGTSPSSATFCSRVAEALKEQLPAEFDGIVPICHTEGDSQTDLNFPLVLRALSGFCVHPNIGALLIVDTIKDKFTATELVNHLEASSVYTRKFKDVTHATFTCMMRDLSGDVNKGVRVMKSLIERGSGARRTTQSVSKLFLAQQCGGSDAFSGVTANPCLGNASRKLINHGGKALIAETPELMGAEAYILSNVRNREVQEKFLQTQDNYRELIGYHGQTAEANPSGGNQFRGLYNIALKSLGAAMKKPPEVCLDDVVAYGEPIETKGHYLFMDSPGNDIESIAGQVASGCNMVAFTTGNGSITNFPFVPTIKILSTTSRYEMLSNDIDFNAGRIEDEATLDRYGSELFDQIVEIASGRKSLGELAGHSQVQLWRQWSFFDNRGLEELQARDKPSGVPLKLYGKSLNNASALPKTDLLRMNNGMHTCVETDLVLPTSACSGMVASQIARGVKGTNRRCVAIAHTEGCGTGQTVIGNYDGKRIQDRVMVGTLSYPGLQKRILLEHGCEKTHNDYMKTILDEASIDISNLDFLSIQLDGGQEAVRTRIHELISGHDATPISTESVDVSNLKLAIVIDVYDDAPTYNQIATMIDTVVRNGGTIVLPSNSEILSQPELLTILAEPARSTIDYGQCIGVSVSEEFGTQKAGLHVMDVPSRVHYNEVITGLASSGVQAILVFSNYAYPGHPLVPTLMVSRLDSKDFDVRYDRNSDLLKQVCEQLSRITKKETSVRAWDNENTAVMLTRGYVGFST